ncbi:MAG: class I SAM-dependent methyltransferase [Breznakibacter sp.]
MDNKIAITLGGVPETLLIPARARYLETKKTSGIIHDPKTVEILDAIDYDFTGRKEVSKGSQYGTAVRTEILDGQTAAFLKTHPDGCVINLGCGLDTRFHRMDNGTVTWYDLDMPETIAIRKHFFTETGRFRFIAKSVLDFSWMDDVPNDRPTLFIAEGLLMYFTPDNVKMILSAIADRFPLAEMLIEGMSPFIANNSGKHADIKKYDVSFKWGIKSGKEIEQWHTGFRFVQEWYYFDRHIGKAPWPFMILSVFPIFRKSMKIIRLKKEK